MIFEEFFSYGFLSNGILIYKDMLGKIYQLFVTLHNQLLTLSLYYFLKHLSLEVLLTYVRSTKQLDL